MPTDWKPHRKIRAKIHNGINSAIRAGNKAHWVGYADYAHPESSREVRAYAEALGIEPADALDRIEAQRSRLWRLGACLRNGRIVEL